jgi:hypothetical protein
MTNSPPHTAEDKLASYGPPNVGRCEVPGIDEADARLLAHALRTLSAVFGEDAETRQRRLALLGKVTQARHPFRPGEPYPDRCAAKLPAPADHMGWVWCGLPPAAHPGDPVPSDDDYLERAFGYGTLDHLAGVLADRLNGTGAADVTEIRRRIAAYGPDALWEGLVGRLLDRLEDALGLRDGQEPIGHGTR